MQIVGAVHLQLVELADVKPRHARLGCIFIEKKSLYKWHYAVQTILIKGQQYILAD